MFIYIYLFILIYVFFTYVYTYTVHLSKSNVFKTKFRNPQTSRMKLFATTNSRFKKFINFAKSFIVDNGRFRLCFWTSLVEQL